MITAQDAAILSLNNEDLDKELKALEREIYEATKKGLRRITVQASYSATKTLRENGFDVSTSMSRDEKGCPTVRESLISW